MSLPAQIAAGKSKFVGNIVPGSVRSDFSTYWNQITPENSGKWGSVEATRNIMNWSQLDTAYNYAKSHGYKFKQHCLVWGSQLPGWMSSLSDAQRKIEVEQWIQLFGQRYPDVAFIDVINEPVKTNYPYKTALGGAGATGYDWIVWSYQKARQYCPKAKLLINEYGTENDTSARNQLIAIIKVLKSKGLIDGIGIQSHCFNLDYMSASQMKTCLDAYAALGLPIYISELDIRGVSGSNTEANQSKKYQELFPVMWTHASVKGITLWGYVEGQTWKTGTGLLNSNGTERAAMNWLKSYVASH
jgi:endo-1,4-beta-xylanase